MANQYVNKVIINGRAKIDLTGDTVDAAHLLAGYTAHDRSGAPVSGACAYDAATADATAAESEILAGKTAYVSGVKLEGSMTNNGGMTGYISTKSAVALIPQGYHDGSGKVGILDTEKAKLIASNIKQGITILGVTGTLEPSSSVKVQAKTVTPSTSAQTVLPDGGYDYLSQVTVNAIPYVETDNSAGGKTVTIAG